MRHQNQYHEHRQAGDRAIQADAFRKRFGNMSKTTFYELVKRGDLSIHKIGRRTFIDADEAERWWTSCAKGPR